MSTGHDPCRRIGATTPSGTKSSDVAKNKTANSLRFQYLNEFLKISAQIALIVVIDR